MIQSAADPVSKHSPPRLTIFLVSALALAYEILLMRLFSIVQYHHFAYMIISLALLGYGASGTFLTFAVERLQRHFSTVFIVNMVLFGITVPACYLVGQHLLFDPDEILWQSRLWLKLSSLYLLLSMPFFFAANCIALAFSRYRKDISGIYAADLLGAGLGSIGIVGMLFMVFPQNVLLLLGGIALGLPALALFELRKKLSAFPLAFLLLAAVPFLLPAEWTRPAVSPYKGLSQQLRIPGSRVVEERSSPLGLLTVVENWKVPFRYAPGLSLKAELEPPEQVGIFIDGEGLEVITRLSDDPGKLTYLGMLTTALPYQLKQLDNVLILGAGAGRDIIQALHFKAKEISAVELNPQIVELVRERANFAGNLYDRDNVRIHPGEARSFLGRSPVTYDLIQVPLLDTFSGSTGGLYTLNENYLYTVEALKEYIAHLSPDGYLCLSRWVRLPPRDSLKLFATAVEALKDLGRQKPADHLLMIRSWQSSSLLIKKSAIEPNEIMSIKKFCREYLFDLAYYPGIRPQEANRFNVLREPYFYQGTLSLLQENSRDFIADYKFNITPATDDKPYFANFFKWRTLPEISKLRGRGGMVLLESGYLILVITLLQTLGASLILILLPVLTWSFPAGRPAASWGRSRISAYFFAIGLAFLFLEIAFMQKFILFLGHPLYAAAAVLAIFLVFAGLGSRFIRHRRLQAKYPVAAIIVLGLILLSAAGLVFNLLGAATLPIRFLAAVLLLGPLAFFMGMPFPLALTEIGGAAPADIPWAWAVNGCASVVGAVLATLLAVHFGFAAVIITALALYTIAAAAFPAPK